MEFKYRLTEDDYVKAGRIKVVSSGPPPWSKVVGRINLVFYFAGLWVAIVIGRIMERLLFTGSKLSSFEIGQIMFSSIPLTLVLSALDMLAFQLVTYWPRRKLRREQYRRNAVCHVETSVRISPDSIAFQSDLGSSESKWTNYIGWKMHDQILVLSKHAGVREILGLGNLDQNQRSELAEILAKAIAKK